MTKSMIENSDRGITLNKTLAWSVACGLIGAGLYVGITVATLATSLDNLSTQLIEGQRAANAVEVRVRALETSAAGDAVQFRNIYSAIDDIRSGQREANGLLRELAAAQRSAP